jgi:predicted N-formylglutamate amidohydrolase
MAAAHATSSNKDLIFRGNRFTLAVEFGVAERLMSEDAAEQYAARFHETGRAGLVLVCDHASRFIPARYHNLGLSGADLERHVAWDIGALALARRLASALDAPLVHPTASRLIIDTNRDPLRAPDAIPAVSEGTPIPGNADVGAAERAHRISTIYEPFHALVAETLARQRARAGTVAVVAIHSFTPVYHGRARPWDVGVIVGDRSGLAEALIAALRADRALTIGVNEPYAPDDGVYHTLQRHGVAHGLATAMIEVRQDHLTTEAGQRLWAARLGAALGSCVHALARSAPPTEASGALGLGSEVKN